MTTIRTRRSLPPGPKTMLPGGQLLPMLRDPLGLLTRLAEEYGDFVRLRLASRDIILVNDPDAIREILVVQHRKFEKGQGLKASEPVLGEGLLTSEGEFHRRQRRLIQPAFQPRSVTAYAGAMVDLATTHRERWKPDEVVDVSREMMRLTLAVVGQTLFGADLEAEAEEIGETLTFALELFRLVSFPGAHWLMRLPLPVKTRFYRRLERLDAILYQMIQDRRSDPAPRRDLLSLLLLAQDEEGTGGMSDKQLRDEAMTLFLAGHETMATAMTWTWYLLSQNPQAEAKLHEELDRVLGSHLPGAGDLERLVYTERVFSESMRIFPPAWIIVRRAVEEVDLGGWLIPENTHFFMSPWVTHRDPRHYPDPERFDPDRWTPEARASRPRFAYFPFGSGPRNCIGEPFAWMEGVLLLATIAQQWRFRLVPGHPVEPRPLITLRTKYGMRMTAERRSPESS